jgi:threonyl-tRNA synthetase
MLVLGDREIEARAVAVRTRSGEQEPGVGWDDLAERLATEAFERRV